MARRDFRRGAHAIRQSRLTQWLELEPTAVAFVAGGGTQLFALSTAEKALRLFTVVRSRLLVGITSDQVAASETQVGALGIAVVSDQAVGIGVTAEPTPITDMNSDLWMVHQLLYNEFLFATGASFESDSIHQYVIDSKAMRKVQDGEDLIVVGELSGAASSGGFNMTVGGRILVKLH